MSQNSQSKGQPRENCTPMCRRAEVEESKRGTGVWVTSGFSRSRKTPRGSPARQTRASRDRSLALADDEHVGVRRRRAGWDPAPDGDALAAAGAVDHREDPFCCGACRRRRPRSARDAQSSIGRARAFKSRSRMSQCCGRSAATVSRPRGGAGVFAPMVCAAASKFQKLNAENRADEQAAQRLVGVESHGYPSHLAGTEFATGRPVYALPDGLDKAGPGAAGRRAPPTRCPSRSLVSVPSPLCRRSLASPSRRTA